VALALLPVAVLPLAAVLEPRHQPKECKGGFLKPSY